jgi:O-glycosyl hydrolase
MTRNRISQPSRHTAPAKVAPALMIAAALGAWATHGAAAGAAIDQDISLAKLEKNFWACDHAATRTHVDADTGAACVGFTDQLKQHKFNGDFNALVAWWQANKAAEHLALDKSGRNATAQLAPAGAH